jgi:RNA polymerase sigma-70 factor (TIGR02943 family)
MAEYPTLSSPKKWVDLYGDYLFRYAVLRVQNVSVAADLVQETFLGALQSRRSFAGRSSEKVWLVGILKHKILDHYRKTSREGSADRYEQAMEDSRQLFNERGQWKAESMGPREWGADPGTILERKEFWDALTRCLGELPPRQRHVFSLREIDGLSGTEVCEKLTISASNLWVIMYRVRMHLRRCLEAKWLGL